MRMLSLLHEIGFNFVVNKACPSLTNHNFTIMSSKTIAGTGVMEGWAYGHVGEFYQWWDTLCCECYEIFNECWHLCGKNVPNSDLCKSCANKYIEAKMKPNFK